jgi:8-oxo-dGTP diphosphatase
MTDVTCALIRNDEGLVLAVRRGPAMDNAGKWEFPGGKTKPGEDHEDCIIREIGEELGISVVISGRLDPVEHDYGARQIRLIPFLCDTLSYKPVLSEHDEYRWMLPGELVTLDLTAADIPIAVQYAAEHRVTVTGEPEKQEPLPDTETGDELALMMSRIHSTEEITMVARSAAGNESLLSQLVTLSSSPVKRVGFMSSWALSKVVDLDPKKMVPYLAMMIDALPGVPNESVQRSFMRIIMKSETGSIPESHHARLIEYCLSVMRTANAPVAPKAYGMEILSSFCERYPDLVNEVVGVVQLAITDASGGMKAAGRKVIARLKSGNRQ